MRPLVVRLPRQVIDNSTLWTDDQVVHGSIPFVTSRLFWITVKIPDSDCGMMQIIGSPADGAAYAAFDDVSWS